MRIRNSMCYCAARASPLRREMYAAGGRYSNAFESLCDVGVKTRRVYSGQGVTILANGPEGNDKSAHLQGSWLRVAEWSSRSRTWRHFNKELKVVGGGPSRAGGETPGGELTQCRSSDAHRMCAGGVGTNRDFATAQSRE